MINKVFINVLGQDYKIIFSTNKKNSIATTFPVTKKIVFYLETKWNWKNKPTLPEVELALIHELGHACYNEMPSHFLEGLKYEESKKLADFAEIIFKISKSKQFKEMSKLIYEKVKDGVKND